MIGFENRAMLERMDFGKPNEVQFCVYASEGISKERTEKFFAGWNEKEATKYQLYARIASFQIYERKNFFHSGILKNIMEIPIPDECDRVLALISRNVGDVIWGLTALPEVLGEVNDETLTHGFVVGKMGSLNQLLMSPRKGFLHELFHFFSCGHAILKSDCYQMIKSLKDVAVQVREQNGYERFGVKPYFPSKGVNAPIFIFREQVNGTLKNLLK